MLYGWDKRCAIKERSRVPEATMHVWDIIGGWPGGFVGQRCFRHKTRKISFQVKYWLGVVLNIVVVTLIVHYFG
jgi:uncharacterized membrane protein YsdA (DUF1294 family)